MSFLRDAVKTVGQTLGTIAPVILPAAGAMLGGPLGMAAGGVAGNFLGILAPDDGGVAGALAGSTITAATAAGASTSQLDQLRAMFYPSTNSTAAAPAGGTLATGGAAILGGTMQAQPEQPKPTLQIGMGWLWLLAGAAAYRMLR